MPSNAYDSAIQHMRDCESPNCPLCPFDEADDAEPPGPPDITGRYRAQLSSADPRARTLAQAQLKHIQYTHREQPLAVNPAVRLPVVSGAGGDLVELITAAVGPLGQRSNGTLVGPCPWHSSKSGSCLLVWPTEGRWWCSSCKRGGNLVQWVALIEGIDYQQARRKLRVPITSHPSRRP